MSCVLYCAVLCCVCCVCAVLSRCDVRAGRSVEAGSEARRGVETARSMVQSLDEATCHTTSDTTSPPLRQTLARLHNYTTSTLLIHASHPQFPTISIPPILTTPLRTPTNIPT